MPISASRPRTAQQRVDDKRAANPVLDAMFNEGLDNIHHYETLAQGTLENHEEVRRLWRNFASYQTKYPDLATELEPRIQPIGEGQWHQFFVSTLDSPESQVLLNCFCLTLPRDPKARSTKPLLARL
jgi:hypothetical protein